MAKKDFDKYYLNIVSQYVAAKNDLADFEQGLKDGYVTEDQVQELAEEVKIIEINKERLDYVKYLLDMPARKSKQGKYTKANKKIIEQLEEAKADQEAVVAENNEALTAIKDTIEKLSR